VAVLWPLCPVLVPPPVWPVAVPVLSVLVVCPVVGAVVGVAVGAAVVGAGCAGAGCPPVAEGGGACEFAGAAGSLSLVSETKASARTIPASTSTSARSATGARQFGVGTSRVRAGAPQDRHHSWSGPTVDAHRGHGIEPGT
jgi:hypothetical protein